MFSFHDFFSLVACVVFAVYSDTQQDTLEVVQFTAKYSIPQNFGMSPWPTFSWVKSRHQKPADNALVLDMNTDLSLAALSEISFNFQRCVRQLAKLLGLGSI